GKCGSKLDNGHKNYVGPSKIALNIIYVIKLVSMFKSYLCKQITKS
ncbi:DUF3575 domain-containing protein, partial [Bacteroides nordii]